MFKKGPFILATQQFKKISRLRRGGGNSKINHHSQSHHPNGSLMGILSAGFVHSIHLLQGAGLIPVWLERQY
jgi:hypothetical protein